MSKVSGNEGKKINFEFLLVYLQCILRKLCIIVYILNVTSIVRNINLAKFTPYFAYLHFYLKSCWCKIGKLLIFSHHFYIKAVPHGNITRIEVIIKKKALTKDTKKLFIKKNQ